MPLAQVALPASLFPGVTANDREDTAEDSQVNRFSRQVNYVGYGRASRGSAVCFSP